MRLHLSIGLRSLLLASVAGSPLAQEVQIPWQRTLADAELLSRESGKPLLLCVNMDGESACEEFARRKYRDARFAELADGFVAIMLSRNRHTPKDHDEYGRRIPCPRFGHVTCGEHISQEPLAFESYFRGQRYAPRHVAISPAGKILFDRYLDGDLTRVDSALRAHGKPEVGEGWAAVVNSRDVLDRERVEAQYLAGPHELRKELLVLAASSAAQPFELLRMGLADKNAELRSLACAALAQVATPDSLPLVVEGLRRELGAGERAALFGALESLSTDDPEQQNELRVQTALAVPSKVVDLAAWRDSLALAGDPEPGPEALTENTLYARIDALGSRLSARPGDPALMLELARESLAAGRLMIGLGRDPSLFLADTVDLARQAGDAQADPLECAALRAQAEWLLSDTTGAARNATLSVELGLRDPGSAGSAELLAVLARARTAEIYFATSSKDAWEPAWLSDALAAFEVLLLHPRARASDLLAFGDLLNWLGLQEREGRVLRAMITRFPADADIHQRFRAHIENSRSLPDLESPYAALLSRDPSNAALQWYAGYATLIVAEHWLRSGDPSSAREAYRRAVDLFDESVALEPAWKDTTDHFVALVFAGNAWISLRAGDHEAAIGEILDSLRRRKATLRAADGNGRTPAGTLAMLRSALRPERHAELRARLEVELEEIAPELVEEEESPNGPPREERD